MALRVLLADESSTIKKVFQLALQDFAVEVQTVNLGIDVASVAESFSPDIIFADVLLQKKSGYEVSAEMKAHGNLSEIPVILMWSSFMDIDEDKMQASGANGRLEKPFDVKTLRKLVEQFVPRTKEQKLSGYLSFPKLPEFEEASPAKKKNASYNPDDLLQTPNGPEPGLSPAPEIPEPTPSAAGSDTTDSFGENLSSDIIPNVGAQADEPQAKDWNMENFDPPEVPTSDEFEELELKSKPQPTSSQQADMDQDLISQDDSSEQDWEQKDFQKYRVEDTNSGSDPSIDYFITDEQVNTDEIIGNDPDEMSGSMEDDLQIEVSAYNPEPPSLPKNIEDNEPDFEPDRRGLDENDPPYERGKTVVLNFDFDSGTSTNSTNPDGPGTALRQLTAELNEEAIQKTIQDQAKDIIEEAVMKLLPELATQIIEKELKRLLEENDQQSPRV